MAAMQAQLAPFKYTQIHKHIYAYIHMYVYVKMVVKAPAALGQVCWQLYSFWIHFKLALKKKTILTYTQMLHILIIYLLE